MSIETETTFFGQKINIVTEPMVFGEPKEMLAWNEYAHPTKRTIVAILPDGTAIDIDHNWIKHCAYIPEALKPRTILTNKELAEWCAKGNGQVHYVGAGNVNTFYSYHNEDDDSLVTKDIRIRKFGDKEWVEPKLEYIGIKPKSVLDTLDIVHESTFDKNGCKINYDEDDSTVPSKPKAKKVYEGHNDHYYDFD